MTAPAAEFNHALGTTCVRMIDGEPYLVTIDQGAVGVVRVTIQRHPEHLKELVPEAQSPLRSG